MLRKRIPGDEFTYSRRDPRGGDNGRGTSSILQVGDPGMPDSRRMYYSCLRLRISIICINLGQKAMLT